MGLLKIMEGVYPDWKRDVNPPLWSFVRNILKDCFDKKIEVVEHFNGMSRDDKERFLNGCVNLFGKYGRVKRKLEKLKNIIKEKEQLILNNNSFESMWKYHSKNQQEIKKYKDEILELNKKLGFKTKKIKSLNFKNQEIINNQKKGCDGLIQRNMELQNRIIYEERVNTILNERIKKFEEIYGGGDNKIKSP